MTSNVCSLYLKRKGRATADTAPGYGQTVKESDVPKPTCSVDGCDREVSALLMCNMHYQRFIRYGSTEERRKRTCSVDGCTRTHYGWGYCAMHHARVKYYGRTEVLQKPTHEELFWAKVQKTDTCWIWLGAVSEPDGYGRVRINQKTVLTHRYAYQQAFGESPTELDHTCHNRRCVNPHHLRPVSRKENSENHVGANRNSKCGVRGVYLHESGRWRAEVTHHRERIRLGSFGSLEEAEAAAIAKRNELFTHNDSDRGVA